MNSNRISLLSVSLVLSCLLVSAFSFSQPKWESNPFEQKVFVENKGQVILGESVLGGDVRYAATNEEVDVFFTLQGLIYQHNQYEPIYKVVKDEKGERVKREKEIKKPVQHYVYMNWLGANAGVDIIAQEEVSYYFTYVDTKDLSGKSFLKARAFKKIIYKNIYPNIDVEYIFPENKSGIKYSLILHPGADPSVIKMEYRNSSGVSLDLEGNTRINTPFGEIIDHAPETFYADNNEPIISSYSVNNNLVSFQLQSPVSLLRTVIIDPWTTVPTFTSFNSAYDIDYDLKGNVYVYGGAQPFQEIKFNSAGVIQWVFTHPTVAPYWFGSIYGDFAVDHFSGSSYILQGVGSAGATKIAKLNAAGGVVGYFMGNTAPDMDELWRIAFNNCTKQAVIGTANHSPGNPSQAAMLDTNVTTMTFVNVLSAPSSGNDPCLLAIDNANDCYMNIAESVTGGTFDNIMIKFPANTFFPTAWMVPTNHNFREVLSVNYVNNQLQGANGYNGIAVNDNFLFTYDGATLKKWNKTTGALLGTTPITATPFTWGGLDVDDCNNVYVGGGTWVRRYDVNLSLVATIPMPGAVYDLRLGPMNKLYVCGKGFVREHILSSSICTQLNLTASVTNSSCTAPTGSASVTVTGGTPGYTYSWSTGQTTQAVSGLAPGTYVVTVIDNSCNPKMQADTIVITGAGSFSVTTSQVNVGCSGGSGSATANVTGGTSPYTYNWSSGGGTNATATGLSAGIYSVTITDAGGCVSVNAITITSTGSVTATAGPASTICAGQTVMLNSFGGTDYAWSSGQSTSSVSVSPTTSTTYSVIVSNGSCADTAYVTVTVNASPALSVTGNSVLCLGDIATLTASGGSNYSWSTGSTNAVITVTPGVTTTYTVTSSNSICTSVVAVTVVVSPPPTAVANNAMICAGQSASLTASGGAAYLWSTGETTSAITPSPASNTTYSVIVSIGSCADTASATVTVNANPTAIAWNNVTINEGASTTLAASGGGSYLWSNGAIDSVITVSPPVTTVYCVTVSNGNCMDTACVTVFVEPKDCGYADDQLFIPDAFSPNGDGKNDKLGIYYPDISCINELVFIVYDRWGEKVFEATDISVLWDGIYKGKPMNSAVFVYYMKINFISGNEVVRKGNISLIR